MAELSYVLSKRYAWYAILLMSIIDEMDIELTLDDYYSVWRKHKPSRSTFSGLVSDLERSGLIKKSIGIKKKSSFRISLNRDLLYWLFGADTTIFSPKANEAFRDEIFDFSSLSQKD